MEDAKSEVSQAQWNRSQAYLANGLQISGDKSKFDRTSIFTIGGNSQTELVPEIRESEEDDSDSDVISEHIGHIGPWQLFWAIIMCLFQFPTTFHIFCLVFQVSREVHFKSEIIGLALTINSNAYYYDCLR